MKRWVLAAAVLAAWMVLVQPAAARDHMWIVSSSASEPFTKAVAQRAAKAAGGPAPTVEDTGTTLGIAHLCAGSGPQHPDAASVARRLRKSEFDVCRRNGVVDLVEIPVGLDMLVVAQAKAGRVKALTSQQMFVALARLLPDESGGLAPNPNRKWSDVDRALADTRIDVRVLTGLSDGREALQDLFLHKGALGNPAVARRWPGGTVPGALRLMRDDSPYVIVHVSEEEIARELASHPEALGVFGYRFLEANRAQLRAVAVDGAEPTPENAYAGKYPGTRKLYLYVNKARLDAARGLGRLGAEFTSSAALGADGYLLALGFVPLDPDDMAKTLALLQTLPMLRREMLEE
ncbi:MAG TPA: substrate-binding domain-containing protein [Hyphomicrobiaceae bacterium]|jgi:phosphate transport system substrate-binding protein